MADQGPSAQAATPEAGAAAAAVDGGQSPVAPQGRAPQGEGVTPPSGQHARPSAMPQMDAFLHSYNNKAFGSNSMAMADATGREGTGGPTARRHLHVSTRTFSSRTMVGGAAEPRLQAVHRDRCTG